jgi:glycosyltransferase involved in cell wall biosynthesis
MDIGGTEKQLIAVIERLDRNKFDPYLVCLRSTDFLDNCRLDCHRRVLNVSSLVSRDGIIKFFLFVGFLKKEKIDIVQTFFFDSTAFGVLAARLARVKGILSSRRDMGFWYTPKILIVLFFVNLLTHRIVVNSEAIKENVHKRERLNLKKIDVIYNGVDLEPFSVHYDVDKLRNELGIPTNDNVVGIVANLNRRVKRVDIFVAAAAKILKEKYSVSFVVVGEGSFRKKLEVQGVNLGISEKMFFVGSQTNIIPYLQLFEVGVLTSESEGFSNAIIEYLAAGLPVVCFDTGGNSELVANGINGYLFKWLDVSGLENRIVEILSNPNVMATISRNNILASSQFTWNDCVAKHELFYRETFDLKN